MLCFDQLYSTHKAKVGLSWAVLNNTLDKLASFHELLHLSTIWAFLHLSYKLDNSIYNLLFSIFFLLFLSLLLEVLLTSDLRVQIMTIRTETQIALRTSHFIHILRNHKSSGT
jgi:hypothetical protein